MLKSEWLVQIYANDTDGDPCIGTGYSIGNGLIITAKHVVRASNRAAEPDLKLIWPDQNKHEVSFTDDDIIYDGDTIDIAVIRCPESLPFDPPEIRYSQFDSKPNQEWDTRGYLQAGKEGNERTDKPIAGTVAGLKQHTLTLTPRGNVVVEEGWGGLSGSPVFINGKLSAIISSRYITMEKDLESVSIPYLMGNSKFCRKIGYRVIAGIPNEDGKFKAELIDRMREILSHRDAETLTASLIKILAINEQDPKKQLAEITHELLDYETDEAICKYLTGATIACISKSGHFYNGSLDEISRIKEIAEAMMGWLVLSSVDDRQIGKLFPDGLDTDSLYFVLGHTTLGGVELVLSRRFRRKSEWSGKVGPSQRGSYQMPVDPRYFSDDEDEVVRKLLLEIWNKVFDSPEQQKQERDTLSPDEVKRLNAELRSLRMQSHVEHYYFTFETEMIEPNSVKKVFNKLLSKNYLNQMTVVEMGSNKGSKVLLMDEHDINASINCFYRGVRSQESTQELS